ncbi:hypothetical protein [Nonomuraea endophytica]|uniref:hypothetical protein n=1 Tax=Nonomuraea endophytica TaxID=714136 RepID=UPI0037CB3A36
MTSSAAELAADVMRWDAERKLERLRDRLAALGINAELRDNNSALMVHRPKDGLPLHVVLKFRAAYYVCQEADERYPTNDPEAAAEVLAYHVRGR